MTKKVLLTGASGGFGFLTAKKLKSNNHRVIGTMRKKTGKNEKVAKALQELGVGIVEMDVTDEESVKTGVHQAIEELNGLDVLVNNAGVGVMGMQEQFTVDDMKKLFDVNVFGVHRMVRAAAPHFRRQKQGLILYISSLLGRITIPFYGPYNASKWALEALAENYRVELSQFGIESCIIEPGGYLTAFMENLITPSDQSTNDDYKELLGIAQIMGEGFKNKLENTPEQDPQKVADAIDHVIGLTFGDRPLRTVVDYMGMGKTIQSYNEMLENLTKGIYTNFELDFLLEPKK